MTTENESHPLEYREEVVHLLTGRWGTVLEILRGGYVVLWFADGTRQTYPVEALYVRNAIDDEPTIRCRVEWDDAKQR